MFGWMGSVLCDQLPRMEDEVGRVDMNEKKSGV